MRTTRERPRAVGTDLGRRAAQAVRRPDITLLLLHRNVRCVCCFWPVESPVAQELARPAARTAESSSRRVSVRGARLCCDIQVAHSRKTLSTLLGCDMRRRARELAAGAVFFFVLLKNIRNMRYKFAVSILLLIILRRCVFHVNEICVWRCAFF